MTEEIPPNFDKPWSESNVILLTENAGEKKLYANRSVLSVFSPVMRAMFSARWSNSGVNLDETHDESVHVAVDYEAMKEILRILFHIDGELLLTGPKVYDALTLFKLYKATDYLDLAHIRKMCIKQMLDRPSYEMAVMANNLDLHDILIAILDKLDTDSISEFLRLQDTRCVFSKKDVAFVHKKITGRDLPKCSSSRSNEVLNLEEIATEIKYPRIDLTKKWLGSDVALLTKNSAKRVLYANKGTLASVSDHFRNLFFNEKMRPKQNPEFEVNDEEPDHPVLHLDVEYATLKTILSIVHHCDMNCDRSSFTEYHPALLYDMYRVASKDQLNIPYIVWVCEDNLCEQPSGRSLDVALKLGSSRIQESLIDSMDWKTLSYWVYSDEKSLVYRNGRKEVVLSSKRTDPLISVKNLRRICKRLRKMPR